MKRNLLLMVFFVSLVLVGVFAKTVSAENTKKLENIQLTSTNFASIRGEVNNNSIDNVLSKVYQSDPKQKFYLFLDSPGGEVFSGLRLVRMLLSTDRNITCVATTAISMAFIIFESCPVRAVTETSVLMSHQVAITSGRQSVVESKNTLKILQGIEDSMEILIARRLGITIQEYQSRIQPEYWIIGGSIILKDRAADKLVTVNCSIETEKSEESYEVETLLGAMTQKRPLCPL